MIKRVSILFFCLILIMAAAGCGRSGGVSSKTGTMPAGVEEILKQAMADADSRSLDSGLSADSIGSDTQSDSDIEDSRTDVTPVEYSGPDAVNDPAGLSEVIDVDLTTLSSTMVYSEVYSMMTEPERYIGKTIKMDGLFAYYHDEATDNYYFACIVQDATACCAQGIEFILTENYKYPDDYPEVNENICVVGVFDTYKEGEYLYCTLRNARLV